LHGIYKAKQLTVQLILLLPASGSDGSIVFSIVAVFFSANTITHEPLHLA